MKKSILTIAALLAVTTTAHAKQVMTLAEYEVAYKASLTLDGTPSLIARMTWNLGAAGLTCGPQLLMDLSALAMQSAAAVKQFSVDSYEAIGTDKTIKQAATTTYNTFDSSQTVTVLGIKEGCERNALEIRMISAEMLSRR